METPLTNSGCPNFPPERLLNPRRMLAQRNACTAQGQVNNLDTGFRFKFSCSATSHYHVSPLETPNNDLQTTTEIYGSRWGAHIGPITKVLFATKEHAAEWTMNEGPMKDGDSQKKRNNGIQCHQGVGESFIFTSIGVTRPSAAE